MGCVYDGERVQISGKAVLYMSGTVEINTEGN